MDRFNLGSHTRNISTTSPEAQRWFDLGLNWCFAFNKVGGRQMLSKALEYDPECVMAHWGIAYGSGPFYNMTWRDHSQDEADIAAAARLRTYRRWRARWRTGRRQLENRLVETPGRRIQQPHAVQPEEFDRWDDDYAAEMRRVYTVIPTIST